VALDDRREMRISSRELGDTLGEAVDGQLKCHVYLTSVPISL